MANRAGFFLKQVGEIARRHIYTYNKFVTIDIDNLNIAKIGVLRGGF